MSFPTRSTCPIAAGCLLLAGVLLHAQTSGPSMETAGVISPSAAPELDATVTTGSAQPRTLASMANQLEPVVEVLTNVLNQYRTSGNRDGEANTLAALGNSYNSLGQQQKAIDVFQQSLAIYRESGDKKDQASTLTRIGDVYRGWGFPDQAVRFYHDALQLHAEINDPPGRAIVLNNLGVTYLSLSNKKKALDYLNQALTAYKTAGDRRAVNLTLINIGAVEIFLDHNAQAAVALFQEAITGLEPLNDRSNQADAFELLGVAWAGLHKLDTAEMNLRRALELYRSIGDGHGEASVLRQLKHLAPRDLASAR